MKLLFLSFLMLLISIIIFKGTPNHPKQNHAKLSPSDFQTVSQIGPGPFSLKDGTKLHLFNPNFIFNEDGSIIFIGRLSALSLCTSKLIAYKQDPTLDSLIINDKSFRARGSSLISWISNDSPDQFMIFDNYQSDIVDGMQLGFEDGRFFTLRNETYIYTHYRGYRNQKFIHSPVIFKLSEPDQVIFLNYFWMSKFDKNWMPFEYQGKLYLEYTVSPHTILQCNEISGDCNHVFETAAFSFPFSDEIGGGSPSILVSISNSSSSLGHKQAFLGLAHTRGLEYSNEQGYFPVRKNFFYLFEADEPFEVLASTSPFDAESELNKIEFGSGMALRRDDGVDGVDWIWLGYGVNDCYSSLSKIRLDTILNKMTINLNKIS
jgi:hypothetical protein